MFLGSLVLSGSGLQCRDGQNLGEVDLGGLGGLSDGEYLLGLLIWIWVHDRGLSSWNR